MKHAFRDYLFMFRNCFMLFNRIGQYFNVVESVWRDMACLMYPWSVTNQIDVPVMVCPRIRETV